MRLSGAVRDGKGDANIWLRKFARAYATWLGQEIVPGSLNVEVGSSFNWDAPELLPHRRTFSLAPYGGERDLFIVPCDLVKPARQPCWLWSTTTAAKERRNVVELIAGVHLRTKLRLVAGSPVELEYPTEWART
jgi:CTP-dependent riboflavin kinase